MGPQDCMQAPLAELLFWWMNFPDEVSVLLLSWPVCSSASCRISFCYLVLISGRRSASISNPSGWCFSPEPCTTNLANIFLYSHHLGLPLNLSLSLHLSLLCVIASGQRCIFYTLATMLRWKARCLALAL